MTVAISDWMATNRSDVRPSSTLPPRTQTYTHSLLPSPFCPHSRLSRALRVATRGLSAARGRVLSRALSDGLSPIADLKAPPSELVRVLEAHGLHRAALVYDSTRDTVLATHPALEPLATYLLRESPDFLGVRWGRRLPARTVARWQQREGRRGRDVIAMVRSKRILRVIPLGSMKQSCWSVGAKQTC